MSTSFLSKGLRFGCTACGKCCVSKATNVFVNEAEVKAMAAALNLDVFTFASTYTEDREPIPGSGEPLLTSLKNKNGACALLAADKRTCTAYAARPVQCRTYPFWAGNLVGEAEWKTEASRCEGIRQDKPLVPIADIAKQLILSQVHARGVGENWTYDSSKALLDEIASPKILQDCIDDFSRLNLSVILYEDEEIRVVDATTAAPTVGEEEDGISASPPTTRRIEFVRAPLVSQTEMIVMSDGQVDHSTLVMPVHRVMGLFALLSLKSLENEAQIPRAWILGAGGGALPVFLNLRAPNAFIDAVEPNIHVLQAARRFFGMTNAKEEFVPGIVSHVATGETFVSNRAGSCPDVVIVDSCFDETAPVASMMDVSFFRALFAALTPSAAAKPHASNTESSCSSVVCINAMSPEGDEHVRRLLLNAREAGFKFATTLAIEGCSNIIVVLAPPGAESRASTLIDLCIMAKDAHGLSCKIVS